MSDLATELLAWSQRLRKGVQGIDDPLQTKVTEIILDAMETEILNFLIREHINKG